MTRRYNARRAYARRQSLVDWAIAASIVCTMAAVTAAVCAYQVADYLQWAAQFQH